MIVGTRLGVLDNAETNLKTSSFGLSSSEIEEVSMAALGKGKSRALALYKAVGDCGQEYR